MKNAGIMLLIVGALVLTYGGFSYTRNRTVLELGSVEITAKEQKNVQIPVIVGVVAMIGGTVMLMGDRRRT